MNIFFVTKTFKLWVISVSAFLLMREILLKRANFSDIYALLWPKKYISPFVALSKVV